MAKKTAISIVKNFQFNNKLCHLITNTMTKSISESIFTFSEEPSDQEDHLHEDDGRFDDDNESEQFDEPAEDEEGFYQVFSFYSCRFIDF